MPDSLTLENVSPSFELIGPRWEENSPLWTARVTIISSADQRSARPVYLSSEPRNVGGSIVHLPGTLLVRVRVDAVTLRIGSADDVFRSTTVPQVVTLLVSAAPDRWTRPAQFTINRMICIAGQFSLTPYYGAQLEELPPMLRAKLAGIFPDGVKNVDAASSGLILSGRPKLPGEVDALINPLPFLLEVASPQDEPAALGKFIVRVDQERISAPDFRDGHAELIRYFQQLNARLNPTHRSADGLSEQAKLRWLRLELTDPLRLPHFNWLVKPNDPSKPTLQFASAEWKLFISDQSLVEPTTPTRGVLAAAPTVTLERDKIIALAVADNPAPMPSGSLKYEAKTDTHDPAELSESITLTDVLLAYDAVDAAARLRSIESVPAPRSDAFDNPDEIEDRDRLRGDIPRSDGKVDPPILWGSMPLDDGWAQLPFFNLNEQLFVDSLPKFSPTATSPPVQPVKLPQPQSQFRGAALFGTDREELYASDQRRPPWNLAVLDATAYNGQWHFETGSRRLDSVMLTLENPQLTSEGLFEIANAAATPEDALPTLEDWIGGLMTLPLKTPSYVKVKYGAGDLIVEADEPYPCPFLLRVSKLAIARAPASGNSLFSSAEIQEWTWDYEANMVLHRGTAAMSKVAWQPTSGNEQQLVDRTYPLHVWLTALPSSRFPTEKVWGTSIDKHQSAKAAIAWRRHPTLPCVQSLPFTQTKLQSEVFCGSRQLVPFGLPMAVFDGGDAIKFLIPTGWRFKLPANGRWARAVNSREPVVDWLSNPRLVLAMLGLPGAALGLSSPSATAPVADPTGFLNRFLFRYDLPLLDQPNALADVPPETDDALPPVPALHRDGFAKRWTELERKAVMAEIDEAEAIAAATGGLAVRGLREPFIWFAIMEAELEHYPGRMVLVDQADTTQRIELHGEAFDALRGLDGNFKLVDHKLRLVQPADADSHLIGGSMAAIVETTANGSRLRDQRGLRRGGSSASGVMITSPVELESAAGMTSMKLCSLMTPAPFQVGLHEWKLWFKGLPMTGAGALSFNLTSTQSAQGTQDPKSPRRGVNDPAATGRDLGYLNGYEWRLGTADAEPKTRWLPLGGFQFFPLSLSGVKVAADGEVSEAMIIGRLQLPAWNGLADQEPTVTEFINRDSAVELTLKNGKLFDIQRAKNDPDHRDPNHGGPAVVGSATWPLVSNEQDTGAPVIYWENIHIDRAADGNADAILLKPNEFGIHYTRQGIGWTLPSNQELRFPLNGDNPGPLVLLVPLQPGADAGVKQLELSLDLLHARHRLTSKWFFDLGDASRLQIQVLFDDQILFPVSGHVALTAALRHGTKVTPLAIASSPTATLDRFGLNLNWIGFATANASLQLLPGFQLADSTRACQGAAMFTFEQLLPLAGGSTAWPKFSLRSGYSDLLFDCQWGELLQQPAVSAEGEDRALPTFDAVLGSSAGRVLAEYHMVLKLESTGDKWPWELITSGAVEIKNLISWPADLSLSAALKCTIPAAGTRPWDHWRHTLNILLSEHRLNETLLVGSSDDNCFLQLRQGTIWTIPAVVEHQLVKLTANSVDGTTTATITSANDEVRWTVAQEVRFCDPHAVYEHLKNVFIHNVLDPTRSITPPQWLVNSSWVSAQGIHSEVLLRELNAIATTSPAPTLKPFIQTRLNELGNTMLIDATLPLFVRRESAANQSGTPLLSTSSGDVFGRLAVLSDFSHQPEPVDNNQWLFMMVPFLGRMQSRQRENSSDLLFGEDPVYALATLPAESAVPKLLRTFTHRAAATPDIIATVAFDGHSTRGFRRLDASSVAEGWFRLLQVRQLPTSPRDKELPSGVTVAAASEADVVSTRQAALQPLFDPRRSFLPPRELLNQPLPVPTPNEWIWTPNSIAQFQAKLTPELTLDHPYAFIAFPLALLGSSLLTGVKNELHRHTAVTLLPTPPLDNEPQARFQPVSLALSPLAAIEFRQFETSDLKKLLVTAELLVFSFNRSSVEVLAERILHRSEILVDEDFVLMNWAAATIDRTAPDSAVAMLRIRELSEVGDQRIVRVSFRFLDVPLNQTSGELTRHSSAIRTTADRVRFAQGQFGGTHLPSPFPIEDFELAPPLVRGLQPLRLLERPNIPEVESANPIWPWGMSGLRGETAYRRYDNEDVGTTNPDKVKQRLWWMAAALRVQFAVPIDRQLLPQSFRTAAVPGFLPAWANTPLPTGTTPPSNADLLDQWTAILPGRRQWIATGLRAGAPYAICESILSQTEMDNPLPTTVSTTIPVQHRAPRPVLLPSPLQDRQDIALRTWGSWFDLLLADEATRSRTVLVSADPQAEFQLLAKNRAASGFRVRLNAPTIEEINVSGQPDQVKMALRLRTTDPGGGEIPGTWDGKLSFRVEDLPNAADAGTWKLDASLSIAGRAFAMKQSDPTLVLSGFIFFETIEKDKLVLVALLKDAPRGLVVTIHLSAQQDGDSTIKNFVQSVALLTRLAERQFASHLAPRYLTWEDPEYNRRLSSLVARKELIIPLPLAQPAVPPPDADQTLTLALVADRREYNSTGKIIYCFTGSLVGAVPGLTSVEFSDLKGILSFVILKSNGVESPIKPTIDLIINTLPLASECDLVKICGGNPLVAGDILRMTLTTTPFGTENKMISLDVRIVDFPVTPVNDAAYAVLRRTDETDECVRFAWGPSPGHIELVDPDDLLGQVVRRRAVYRTTDTLQRRDASETFYAVQKTTAFGSTHFSSINEQPR